MYVFGELLRTVREFKLITLGGSPIFFLLPAIYYYCHILCLHLYSRGTCTFVEVQGTDSAEQHLVQAKCTCVVFRAEASKDPYCHKAPHSCPPTCPESTPFVSALVFLTTTQEAGKLILQEGEETGMCYKHKSLSATSWS